MALLIGGTTFLIAQMFMSPWREQKPRIILQIVSVSLVLGHAYIGIEEAVFLSEAEQSEDAEFGRERWWPFGMFIINQSEYGAWVHD